MTYLLNTYWTHSDWQKWKIDGEDINACHHVTELDLSDCGLYVLPHPLPQNLVKLYCEYNYLTTISTPLPDGLEIFDCSHNQIISIPSGLPRGLITLECSVNKIAALPEDLPLSLTTIGCSDNHLTTLPLFVSPNLISLDCSSNRLSSLSSLARCRFLTDLHYDDNPIEFVPPNLRNMENEQNVYLDKQNVHDHTIQESVRHSIENITEIQPTITKEVMVEEILQLATDENKLRLLIEFMHNNEIHSTLKVSFTDVLLPVWSVIREHEHKTELVRILSHEMQAAEGTCFTGRISRLVSSLAGFSDRVVIEISIDDQISHIVTRHQNLKLDAKVTKENIIAELNIYGFKHEKILEWTTDL